MITHPGSIPYLETRTVVAASANDLVLSTSLEDPLVTDLRTDSPASDLS